MRLVLTLLVSAGLLAGCVPGIPPRQRVDPAPEHPRCVLDQLDQQPIGWDPDLNDGVRLNIRPWLSVPDVGKKGAGVLRDKPNIKWGKDRGKDVESAPWFGVFGGERINDWHLTVGEKMRARGRKE